MQVFQQKKTPIYVISGNHRWQAYSMLRTKYSNQTAKIKELSLDSMLTAVYWWPDLSEQSIDEMRALAMHKYVKGECHISMTFWDEIKFICNELTHKPQAMVSETIDSTSCSIPVYKWTPGLKEDMMHKLGKNNIQSLDPFFQLAQVHQDVWDLALQLSQPAKTMEGRSQKLKPLTSITTFRSLAGLSNNEKLHLLSMLYKGEIDIGKVEAKAHKLKVQKQVKAAFMANAGMLVEKIISLLGQDVYHKEVECWTNTFSQIGKGRALRPENFTH